MEKCLCGRDYNAIERKPVLLECKHQICLDDAVQKYNKDSKIICDICQRETLTKPDNLKINDGLLVKIMGLQFAQDNSIKISKEQNGLFPKIQPSQSKSQKNSQDQNLSQRSISLVRQSLSKLQDENGNLQNQSNNLPQIDQSEPQVQKLKRKKKKVQSQDLTNNENPQKNPKKKQFFDINQEVNEKPEYQNQQNQNDKQLEKPQDQIQSPEKQTKKPRRKKKPVLSQEIIENPENQAQETNLNNDNQESARKKKKQKKINSKARERILKELKSRSISPKQKISDNQQSELESPSFGSQTLSKKNYSPVSNASKNIESRKSNRNKGSRISQRDLDSRNSVRANSRSRSTSPSQAVKIQYDTTCGDHNLPFTQFCLTSVRQICEKCRYKCVSQQHDLTDLQNAFQILKKTIKNFFKDQQDKMMLIKHNLKNLEGFQYCLKLKSQEFKNAVETESEMLAEYIQALAQYTLQQHQEQVDLQSQKIEFLLQKQKKQYAKIKSIQQPKNQFHDSLIFCQRYLNKSLSINLQQIELHFEINKDLENLKEEIRSKLFTFDIKQAIKENETKLEFK